MQFISAVVLNGILPALVFNDFCFRQIDSRIASAEAQLLSFRLGLLLLVGGFVLFLFLGRLMNTAVVIVNISDAHSIGAGFLIQLQTDFFVGFVIQIIMVIAVHTGHSHDILYVGIFTDPLTVGIVEAEVHVFEIRHIPGGGVRGILGGSVGVVLTQYAASADAQLATHLPGTHTGQIIDAGNVLRILTHELLINFSGIGIQYIGGIRIGTVKIDQIQLVRCRLEAVLAFVIVDFRQRGMNS